MYIHSVFPFISQQLSQHSLLNQLNNLLHAFDFLPLLFFVLLR